MDKLKNKMVRFMTGRYGPDELYKALFVTYFALLMINIFFRSPIISVLMWAAFIWSLFRFFSKNIYMRQQENMKYLQAKQKLVSFVSRKKTMLTDKEHYYKKCKNCKNTLRLPRRSGTHTAVCPICKEKMEIKIR